MHPDRVASRAAVDDVLQRMHSSQAMITVTADRARREADASDTRRRRGMLRSPLDGVPVAWKDVFDVAGTVTTAGSRLLRDGPVADRDSDLVRRFCALGMVTVGKTNLSEFAFSGLGINEHFGTPVNPVDPDLVPGGSSSGAAVAVATGMVPLAVGTDTSGSVRVPAAFTGCVGYRASHQRYGRNDFRALSPSLDSVGVLARSVGEIDTLDRLLCTRDAAAPVREAVIPAGEWVDDCTPGVRAVFEAAVARLRVSGMTVTVRPIDSMDRAQRLLDRHGTIVGADAHAAYSHLAGVEPATRRRLSRNADVADKPVRQAMPSVRRMLREELDGAVMLCPTVRHEPPVLKALLVDDAAYDAANASTLRTTMVLSYLGTCGVSLPLPGAGLLVSAPEGCDAALLATAEFCAAIVRA